MPSTTVLLHGFAQTGHAWAPVRALLEARGHPVIAPDLRGHGAAADRRPVSAQAVFSDLDTMVDGGVLTGYSMGGRLALAYAVSRPGRVCRLVLVGASPGLADAQERRRREAADEALARRIEERGVQAFAEEWGRLPLFAGQPAAVRAAARAERLRQTPEGLAAALRGLGTAALAPCWDALPELQVPVSLVVGERDDKFRQVAVRMAEKLPQARVVVVRRAGHAAHLEAPEAVAAVIAG